MTQSDLHNFLNHGVAFQHYLSANTKEKQVTNGAGVRLTPLNFILTLLCIQVWSPGSTDAEIPHPGPHALSSLPRHK